MTKDQLEALQMRIADTFRTHGLAGLGYEMKVSDGLSAWPGRTLRPKPILLTFEDSPGTQFRLAIEVKEAPAPWAGNMTIGPPVGEPYPCTCEHGHVIDNPDCIAARQAASKIAAALATEASE